MRNSQYSVSWKTYGLAFAIALSPALMQTEPTCAQPGDTTLSTFELEVLGQNHIAFDPDQRVYWAWLPSIADTAIVRAYSTDPEAEVTYQYRDATEELIDAGWFSSFVGGGEMTLDGLLLPGESYLRIFVKTPGTTFSRNYTAIIQVGCSDCDDGNACTQDLCAPVREVCVHPLEPGNPACDAGGATFACTEQGIRDAIAMGGGPHTFDCAGPTTVVTTATIVIDNDVILDGEGNLTVEASGQHNTFEVPRRFSPQTKVAALLNGFVVTHSPGPTPSGSSDEASGILNYGTLTVANSTISGNRGIPNCFDRCGPPDGGGIYNADASATLVLVDSVVSQNEADWGAGIFGGGAIWITDSTVSDNTACLGCEEGSGIRFGGSVTITNSTVSDNEGLGVEVDGELALMSSTVSGNGDSGVSAGVLTATNSTVSENGGVGLLVGASSTITNCTLSGNAGSDLHGYFGPVTLTNTVVDGQCVGAAMTSNGHNIESPGDTCGFDQGTDLINVPDVGLGPLQDNGGPTETHALLPGSVAIDWIPAAMCQASQDQRGVARPQGVACDVGAFELEQ